MPQTQLSQKFGSDNSIFGLKETKKTGKSKFDFSKKNFTTLDIGSIVPVDWFMTFPGDKVKLNIRYLLDTFPLEVPPMNSYTIRTHWYFIKLSALWKGWNTFITRGRSGNIDLEIPSISKTSIVAPDAQNKQYSVPNGLLDYLGLKPVYYNADASVESFRPYLSTTGTLSTTGYELVDKLSALAPFAYQKICRFNYLSPNLSQNNLVWFPEDLEDHWYIDYGASNLNGCYFVPESATMPQSDFVANEVPTLDDNVVDLRQLRYAMFGDDYFTTAKPWLVRGDEQMQEFDLTGKLFAEFLENVEQSSLSQSSSGIYQSFPSSSTALTFVGSRFLDNSNPEYSEVQGLESYAPVANSQSNFAYYTRFQVNDFAYRLGIDLSKGKGLAFGLTANTLRNLLALSVWQERNTLTDGSYNRTIQAHWNEKPKAPEYAPMYLGGTSDVISFGNVVQQSSSVSGSPLGTKAGTGSAQSGSDVFTFDCEDYGIIMGVMFISPEVVYTQGIGREWTDLTFDEQFQPEFANLGYQPILNKELFVSGDSNDDDLFGYQTRYAYLKQRKNSVSGMFDLNSEQDNVFGPYVQARRFSSLPELSQQFVSMSPDNIDRSFLSFRNLPAFKLQFASDVSLIRALPYQSTPETFGF